MKTDRLKLNPDNPRTIGEAEFQKLCESIERDPEFLKLRPIVHDENGTIRAGNQRFRAIKHLNWQDIPDAYVKSAEDFTEEQLRRFELLDNAPEGISGQWDDAQLFQSYDKDILEALGFDNIQPPELPDVADQIRNEAEYQKERQQADETADRIEAKISQLKQSDPEAFNHAALIALDTRKGNEVLILVDPTFTDMITELRRYVENGEDSPLDKLLDHVHQL